MRALLALELAGKKELLEVSHLSKEYPTPRGPLEVLSEVNLSLAAGEAAAIMGPSGSGKSSLLYVLGGLEPPSSGSVSLEGADLFSMGPSRQASFRNRRIGFIFQDHCLLPQCSVLENVLVPTLVRHGDDVDKNEERENFTEHARSLVEQVGLSDRIDHRPAELSGGERQRVAIARALIRSPRLILCDEPTGNLDQATADTVTSLLLELHRVQNNILIAVTHSAHFAAQFPIRFELAQRQLARVES